MANGSTLIAHCGARIVERAELATVPVPESTNTYKPFGHDVLADAIEAKAQDMGLGKPLTSTFALSDADKCHGTENENPGAYHGPGCVMFCLYTFQSPSDGRPYAIGGRHGLNKVIPVGLVGGEAVFVCDNLALSGQTAWFHKHNNTLDLDDATGDAFSRLRSHVESFQSWMNRLAEIPMRKSVANEIILDAADAGLLSMPEQRMVRRAFFDGKVEGDKYPGFASRLADGVYGDAGSRSAFDFHGIWTDTVLKRFDPLKRGGLTDRSETLNDVFRNHCRKAGEIDPVNN